MARPSSSGRESTGEQKDEAVQLMGIVVESDGMKVGIYNSWIHQGNGKDVIVWDNRDAYEKLLYLGDWVTMVWRREMVTRVTRWDGESPMKVRQCPRTGDVLLLTPLSLKSPDAGKHEKQLWSEDFHSVGLLPYVFIKDMKVGGGTKDMWIAWVKDRTERDKHLQRTGYDVVWKVAIDQGEKMYANGRAEAPIGAEDSGVASQVASQSQTTPLTPPQSDSSGGESKVESKFERTRKRGSFPDERLNRVGIITGHKENTPFYYVWTPGAPPRMEGRVLVRKVEGEELIHVCDWIHFRVSKKHEEMIFINGSEDERFEVADYKLVDRYFPTQTSPNKLTIEIAIRKMAMSSENTKLVEGELFYEDEDFGWIGDRNNNFINDYPLQEGTVIEFEGVIRRVKPKHATDSAWMILTYKVNYRGPKKDTKKIEKKPPARENRREDNRSNGREERRDEYRSNGREERREEYRSNGREDQRDDYPQNGKGAKKGRRDHFLLQLPKFVGREEGDVIESTGIVEGMGNNGPEVFVWLVDVAASGVVNGGAKYLKIGDVVYGKFRLQRNSKWGSQGTMNPGELPREMSIAVRKDKVFVTTQIIYDAERDEYRNPWFETVFDTERKMPRDPVDKEVYHVELNKMRNGFNIHKLLN